MGTRLAAGVLVAGLALGGCSAPDSSPSDTAARVESLWQARTAYTGDNSRVTALVDAVGLGLGGSFGIALDTARQPYGVTVTVQDPGKPFDVVDVSENATLLLGLVGNLDHVSVVSAGRTYAFNAAEASSKLGYDVKDLGRDRGRLAEYLSSRD